MWFSKPVSLPEPDDALPGRSQPIPTSSHHYINGRAMIGPCPQGLEELMVGMGCFWGAERAFWSLPGVYLTAVGYGAGYTPNPFYEEVCTGLTGHNELVRIWYEPGVISLEELLVVFWQRHDPTQGMRQGNDVGTQYRSGIYVRTEDALARAETSRDHYQQRLTAAGRGIITTEIQLDVEFYPAEAEHQQYLAKHPAGYCGLGGCGVTFDD
ncbi:peptide-methionine (S)-S-oxide reductase MsrA [Parathalassolituus penaei]|uniref:Peptide methionine sulfoxide reductase MsrA n=1 Tax=Parathalassolituus penaei TaxID=2997323 RepID=A0A9X3IVE5_9GAMM|nr:peptide-methionine (S)-S-oxide reductase MsrA [Parathalassolituus penaei]MCY0967178.1 peptide-methionine (S)-S-oxide reductase MsrA [Parathalassolituus penaei]